MSELKPSGSSEGEASAPSMQGSVKGAEGLGASQPLSSQTGRAEKDTLPALLPEDTEVVFRDLESGVPVSLKPQGGMDLHRPPPDKYLCHLHMCM